MHAQNFFASLDVRQVDGDLAIEPAGAQECRVEDVRPVRRSDNDHAFLRVEAVHLHEQGVERLLALVVAAAHAVAAVAPDGVYLVNENDAGRGFFALLEHVADARSAHAHEHLHKIRAADGEEGNVGFAGNGPGQQRFAGARRAHHQHALGNAAAEFLKFFRVAQKLDQFLHFFLGFLHASHIAEGDFIFVARQHAGFGFAEIERAFAGHADLLAEKEIKQQQEKPDGEEADDGLCPHVGLGFDGRLNPCIGQFLLQIGGEI